MIADFKQTKALLEAYQIKPDKNLGQNFLISPKVCEQIIDTIDGAYIFEIGAGLGALSEHLAAKAQNLCLLELDKKLYNYLQANFKADHINIINCDALDFDFNDWAKQNNWPNYHVVANLPYYITSALIRHIITNSGNWRTLTLMMQKEVAQKLILSQGKGGPLAVLLQYFGQIEIIAQAKAAEFWPAPTIDSAILKVSRHSEPPFSINDLAKFEKFIEAAFSLRRKTLVNSLSNATHLSKESWQAALSQLKLNPAIRAEQLALTDFANLYEYYIG